MSHPSDRPELSIGQAEKERVQFCDLSSNAIKKSTEDGDVNITDLFIFRIPERLRYRKEKPFEFNYALTIAFSCSGAICGLSIVDIE